MSSAKLKEEVARRLKQARERLGETQKQLGARIGMPVPSLRDYELGNRIPGGEALAALMRAGINPAWLLDEKGPMLLDELEQARARLDQVQAERDALQARVAEIEARLQAGQPAASPLNQPAMRAIIAGTVEAKAPGAPADQIARLAVDYYCRAISEGMITPEGIGEGNLKKAG